LSQATQVKLLRVLDTGSFRHVGGTTEIRVDARLIVATHRDLGAMVRQRLFREDLLYRLSAISIELPPLRERLGDVDLLVAHALARFEERYGHARSVAPEARQPLRAYRWPGNVRELLHVVESAAVLCDGEILVEHLPAPVRSPGHVSGEAAAAEAPVAAGELASLEELERAHVQKVLQATGGHRGRAAAILGISERNLYRKILEYKLD
jgi:Nif-specific regulatory protein